MFSSLSFLPSSIYFFERETKKVCGSGDGKKLEKCGEIFFSFHMTDYVFIFTYCNLNAILALINRNEQYKKRIGHESSTL